MISAILLIIGIILLLKGADLLVDGSSSLAKKLKVPAIVIGLTIIAFGTSMPELVVNVLSAIKDNGDIALGNVVGSNISNILLVLGLAACVRGIKVKRSTTWKEIPFSLLATIVLLVMASAAALNHNSAFSILRSDGIVLLAFFSIFLFYIVQMTLQKHEVDKKEALEIKTLSTTKTILFICAGLVGLFLGGKWTVEGAVMIARWIGMSEYFISLTIIAVGTSLPELITTFVAAKKGNMDLAVGNIIGSNIFNIFWILGISAIISPINIPLGAFTDIIVLLIATFLLFIFMFTKKKHELERWQGVVFVLLYVASIVNLIIRG